MYALPHYFWQLKFSFLLVMWLLAENFEHGKTRPPYVDNTQSLYFFVLSVAPQLQLLRPGSIPKLVKEDYEWINKSGSSVFVEESQLGILIPMSKFATANSKCK